MLTTDFFFTNKEQYYDVRSEIRSLIIEVTDETTALMIEVALCEVMNNSFRFAEIVSLKIRIIGRKIFLKIEDSGRGFTFSDLCEKLFTLKETPSLEEAGRGIFITKMLMDKVIYNQEGNKVVLIKNIECAKGD